MAATDTVNAPDQMAQLAADAQVYRPRLFAIYGLLKERGDELLDCAREFLGWGLEFSLLGKAFFCEPGSSGAHCSDTAHDVLRFYQRVCAEVRLEWLDER